MANQANPANVARPLVNNKLFSDVSFAVGPKGTVIYGHRSPLASASDTFLRMFTSELTLATSHRHIEVPDIEPNVFLEMLHFIYYGNPTISADNCAQLYHAAVKYELDKLVGKCLEFAERDEDLAIKIFTTNTDCGNGRLNEACLRVICNNPLKLFKNASFLQLPPNLMIKIAGQTLRCNSDQLEDALQKWTEHQKDEGKAAVHRQEALKKRKRIDDKKQELITYNRCRKWEFFGNIYSKWKFTKTYLQITAKTQIDLYGVGLYIGKMGEDYGAVSVQITGSVTTEGKPLAQIRADQVPFKKEIYVYDCMFEKISIQAHSVVLLEYEYRVNLDKYKGEGCISFKSSELSWIDNNSVMVVRFLNDFEYKDGRESNIAYLLYQSRPSDQ